MGKNDKKSRVDPALFAVETVATQPSSGLKKIDNHLSHQLRQLYRQLLVDLRATYRLARKNDLSLLASSVSFYCIFSFVPMLILCFILSQMLMGDGSHSTTKMIAFLETVVPTMAPWISENLVTLLQRNILRDSVGLAIICWATYDLFVCLQSVFAKISLRGEDRDFIGSNFIALICFGMVAFSTTLLLVVFTTKATVLRAALGLTHPRFGITFTNALALVSAVWWVLVSITFIYKFLPTQKVRLGFAFRGSLLFFALFCVGRAGYQSYVQLNQGQNQSLYGIFSTLIFVIIWIYYLANIFLFSAQYAILLEETRRNR